MSALYCHQDPRADKHAHDDGVRLPVHRTFRRFVNERGGKASAIGDCQLETNGSSTGIMIGIIIADPDKNRWNRRIKPRGDEKKGAVFDVVVRGGAEDGVTCDGQGEEAEHDGSARGDTVGEIGGEDGEHGGDSIGRDRKELSSNGGVAESLNDSGDKQTKRVERGQNGEICQGR